MLAPWRKLEAKGIQDGTRVMIAQAMADAEMRSCITKEVAYDTKYSNGFVSDRGRLRVSNRTGANTRTSCSLA